ncbi:MAG TPA: transposase, partial [Acetobacteraceae bacterium]|nr:transposase [Acetobacteraceae bacterium]
KGRVTAVVFIEFLKRLLINATTPIFVIVDGHPTHRAKSATRFVAASARKLALFLLPPYSPELSPDEHVWNELKAHGTGRKLITSLTQLRRTVLSHMRQLQKPPGLVQSFSHARTTSDARARWQLLWEG